MKIYEECISIPQMAGNPEAYLRLIQTYKENDAVFTQNEANQIEYLVSNNKEELMRDKDAYVNICFEIGKLYWYYYDYGDGSDNQITRGKSSLPWFNDVINNAEPDYENLGMSKAYYNIGVFYRDITTNVTEANDKGKYKPLFDNLSELTDTLASDENESEIVRLELIELSRSALQQYSTKFKQDGVSKDQLLKLYKKLESTVKSVETSTDKTSQKKEDTIKMLPETLTAVEAAYGTTQEGDGV